MGMFNRFLSLLDSRKLNVDARFEMLRESISGTMSQFRVVRDRQTGEIFGLKRLDADKTELFEGRFKGLNKPSEGEIAIQFDHPNIVKTLKYGETTDGKYYVLMEYLEGPGLNSLLVARDQILDGKRLGLMEQMTEAIGAVHGAGFIHRDICPRNFICSKDARSLKLIDFGLTLPATPEFMQPGNRTGTPQYMSPEIARRRKTDHRVDIFSLGVTFYQLITFELPWPSADTTGTVAMLHDTQKPVDILTLAPQLDPAIAKLIHDCLANDPAGRPADAAAVLRTLRLAKDRSF
jgi:serine/threonine-protein kinase